MNDRKAVVKTAAQTLVESQGHAAVQAYTNRPGQVYERPKQTTAVALHYSGRGAPRAAR